MYKKAKNLSMKERFFKIKSNNKNSKINNNKKKIKWFSKKSLWGGFKKSIGSIFVLNLIAVDHFVYAWDCWKTNARNLLFIIIDLKINILTFFQPKFQWKKIESFKVESFLPGNQCETLISWYDYWCN